MTWGYGVYWLTFGPYFWAKWWVKWLPEVSLDFTNCGSCWGLRINTYQCFIVYHRLSLFFRHVSYCWCIGYLHIYICIYIYTYILDMFIGWSYIDYFSFFSCCVTPLCLEQNTTYISINRYPLWFVNILNWHLFEGYTMQKSRHFSPFLSLWKSPCLLRKYTNVPFFDGLRSKICMFTGFDIWNPSLGPPPLLVGWRPCFRWSNK